MDHKKVCMLLHGFYQQDARVKNYVAALLKNEYEVSVICLEDDRRNPIHVDGLHIIRVPLKRNHKRGYFLETAISLFLFSLYTLLYYIVYRYQVIHVHNMPDFLIFAAILPKLCGCKLILDIHDPMPEMFRSKFMKKDGGVIHSLLVFEERISARLANIVITANDNFREILVARGIPEEKIKVVLNIANPEIFNGNKVQGINKSRYTLIYPGTLAPRYSLEVAVLALPELIKQIPNVIIRFVGEKNAYSNSLQNLAQKIGVQGYLEIIDPVPLEELPGLLSSSDIGIYPACPDPHMSIATPGKIFEYVAMGLPVVSSRLKALTIYFPDECVSYFEPGNVDEFTKCIVILFQFPEIAKKMVTNNQRKFVEKHPFENEMARYLSIVNDWILPDTKIEKI